MSLTTMLFAWVLVIALRVRGIGDPAGGNPQTIRRWVLFGLLWGLIALSNPSLLLFLPVCGLWMLFGAKDKSTAFAEAVLAGIVFLAVSAPDGRGAIGLSSTPSFLSGATSARSFISATLQSRSPCRGTPQ